VLATGPLPSVQAEGRVGFASWGVPRSGACDGGAYRLGLRLVGNAPGAASLEVTLGGLAVRAVRPVVVAVTGARCPGAAWNAPTSLAPGQVLRLGAPAEGLRSYLAVRGGVWVPPVLGSRSTCSPSGLGPPRMRGGDVLVVGSATTDMPGVDDDSWSRLLGTTWTVGTDSDRVGVRLGGARLEPAVGWQGVELPSEGVLRGAVQVPPSGEPVVFLADCPVTGGYPVLASLREPVGGSDVDRLAQARPGQQVRFSSSRARLGP